MNISLEEYIRRKKAGETNQTMAMSKREEEENRVYREQDPAEHSTLSKFERLKLCDDDDVSTQNSSIEFAKEIEKLDHPNCCNFKPFRTIEDKTRVKIKSQQWRLGSDFEEGSGVASVRGGRVGKNYRNNSDTKVVRGNFTYQSSGNRIAGIVRNNRRRFEEVAEHEDERIIIRKTVRQPHINKNIQINVDVTNFVRKNQFLQDFPSLFPRQPTPIPTPKSHIQMSFETDDLIRFLAAKKKRTEEAVPKEPIKEELNPSVSQYEREAFGGMNILCKMEVEDEP